jgi:diguanylate cyclase (GGDEF)-like protein
MASRAPQAMHELPVPSRLAIDIGRVVANAARGSDVVGRMGSSEFAIIAPMTEQRGAVELVERLRDMVAAMPPTVTDGKTTRVSLRAGLATISDADLGTTDGADLLIRATTALRYAQSSRSGDMRMFDEVPSTFV